MNGLVVFAPAMLVLAACEPRAEDNAAVNVEAETENVAATADAAEPADTMASQAFADAVTASDNFEIASSKLAVDKDVSQPIKAFAVMMIEAHTKSTDKLKAAAAKAEPSIKPSPIPAPARQAKLDALARLSGPEFEAAYLDAQIAAHEAALNTLTSYATSGSIPELKSFAIDLVPAVSRHLDEARALKDAK